MLVTWKACALKDEATCDLPPLLAEPFIYLPGDMTCEAVVSRRFSFRSVLRECGLSHEGVDEDDQCDE